LLAQLNTKFQRRAGAELGVLVQGLGLVLLLDGLLGAGARRGGRVVVFGPLAG